MTFRPRGRSRAVGRSFPAPNVAAGACPPGRPPRVPGDGDRRSVPNKVGAAAPAPTTSTRPPLPPQQRRSPRGTCLYRRCQQHSAVGPCRGRDGSPTAPCRPRTGHLPAIETGGQIIGTTWLAATASTSGSRTPGEHAETAGRRVHRRSSDGRHSRTGGRSSISARHAASLTVSVAAGTRAPRPTAAAVHLRETHLDQLGLGDGQAPGRDEFAVPQRRAGGRPGRLRDRRTAADLHGGCVPVSRSVPVTPGRAGHAARNAPNGRFLTSQKTRITPNRAQIRAG